jgi:spermidine/putrescine transport system substrate-binding protein
MATLRVFTAALAVLFVFSACTSNKSDVSGQPTQGRTLNLYCWSNYFAPEVIKRFEEQTKSKVVFNYFSSNEELLAKLQAGARGYDIIVPTAYLIGALKSLDLIEKIGPLDWPELKTLLPQFKNTSFDPKFEYSVPYAWGTTGIAVNRAKIKAKVDSWSWLFDHPELKGQISMLDDAPTVVGSALKYLGYGLNEGSPEALAKAKELLAKQKKILRSYTPESQPVLASGEVALAQAYSGDVLQIHRRKNPNIEYVLPKEGGELFVDNLAIPKGAPSPDLAREFMRFTLQRQISTIQTEHLFFSPVVDLRDFAPAAALVKDPAILPSDASLKKFELLTDEPKRIEAVQRLWTELKSM